MSTRTGNYEARRRADGKKQKSGLRRCYRVALEHAPAGTNAGQLALAVVCHIVKAQHRLSYRDLAAFTECHTDMFRIYGMTRPPSKSTLHAMSGRITEAGPGYMHRIVLDLAGPDAYGDLVGDSTGFGTDEFVRWYNAKYGDGSRRGYAKLHILAAPGGRIVGFEATTGTAADSPAFRRILARIPRGRGTVVLDKAYLSRINCKGIAENGRVPVIPPKANTRYGGYDAFGKMCDWARRRPGEFARAYGIRSLVETVFSSMKERTGAFVRARSLRTRTVELFCKILCYNMRV